MRGVHSIMIRKICKKATIWLLAGVIGLSAVTVQAAEVDNGASYPITTNSIEGWPQGPDTYSETAVLMDADTGTILYNKGMDEKRYPASITKIITALLALRARRPPRRLRAFARGGAVDPAGHSLRDPVQLHRAPGARV